MFSDCCWDSVKTIVALWPCAREPDTGEADNPLAEITIQKCDTAPPTAVMVNVPVGGPPAGPCLNTTSDTFTCTVPALGEGEGEGDGGDGDGEGGGGEGECECDGGTLEGDRPGEGRRGVEDDTRPGVVPGAETTPASEGPAEVAEVAEVGETPPEGDMLPEAEMPGLAEGPDEVDTKGPAGPAADVFAGDEPVAASAMTITTATISAIADGTVTMALRRTTHHDPPPGRLTKGGKPSASNDPARWETVFRYDTAEGEPSAHSRRMRARSPGGSAASGSRLN